MTKVYLTGLAVLVSGSAAFATAPDTVTKVASSCCAAIAACCGISLPCCP